MEEILGKVMFTVPSDHTVSRVTITEALVNGTGDAMLERDPGRKPNQIRISAANGGASANAIA